MCPAFTPLPGVAQVRHDLATLPDRQQQVLQAAAGRRRSLCQLHRQHLP